MTSSSLTLSKSSGGPNRRLVDYFFVCGLSTTLESYDATSTTSPGSAPLAGAGAAPVSSATPTLTFKGTGEKKTHTFERKRKKFQT